MTKKEIAKFIDHTLLAPDAGKKDIIQLCQEALRYDFASVCVNPLYVTLASEQLKSSDVKVCTVIGFPLGAVTSYDKAIETKKAIKNGADEVDMVIDIGAAKEERYTDVKRDISAVVKAARTAGKAVNKKIIVKVILETCLLSDENIENCCICAEKAGADFVKTSTGFASPKGIDGNPLPNGANEHHVSLMKKTVGKKMKVKASGGIRSPRVVIAMLEAGAARIGTSSGASIVENWNEDLQINLPE